MYAPATAARLREIKQRWDPTNIFCRAHVFV
ncbi:BBE domain-containing protein [Microbacterium sp. YY-03]